jgi:hypothetical protein
MPLSKLIWIDVEGSWLFALTGIARTDSTCVNLIWVEFKAKDAGFWRFNASSSRSPSSKSISSSAPYASYQKRERTGRGRSYRDLLTCRPCKKQAPAGDLEMVVKNPDPGQTSPPQLVVVNSGYLQGGIRRRVAISSISPRGFLRVRASNIPGGGRGGRLYWEARAEEGNGSWLGREIRHHGKHRGPLCRVVVGYKRWVMRRHSRGFRPHEVVVGGALHLRGKSLETFAEGGTASSMACSSAVGILPSGIPKRLGR